jgi:hypothetical protein
VVGREQARSCADRRKEGEAGDEQQVFEAEKQCAQHSNGKVFVEAFLLRGLWSMSASLRLSGVKVSR